MKVIYILCMILTGMITLSSAVVTFKAFSSNDPYITKQGATYKIVAIAFTTLLVLLIRYFYRKYNKLPSKSIVDSEILDL